MTNNNNKRGAKQQRGRLARMRNGPVQNLAGTSHRDMVPQVRKFVTYNSLGVQNTAGDFSIGVTSFNVTPAPNTTIGDLIKTMGITYEQYRIRRIRIRAQIGKGYTNDLRLKTIIASRVDVDNQDTAQTGQSFKALVNSENAIVKTFTEKGNILVADYRPIMFDKNFTSNDVVPVLPSGSQWYRIAGASNHQWRGAVLAVAIPDTTLAPNQVDVTLWQEIDIEFRGRHQISSTFTTSTIYDRLPPTISRE
jgi:hypothetical protein